MGAKESKAERERGLKRVRVKISAEVSELVERGCVQERGSQLEGIANTKPNPNSNKS